MNKVYKNEGHLKGTKDKEFSGKFFAGVLLHLVLTAGEILEWELFI